MKTISARRRPSPGFTLIEIVLAIGIVAVAVLSIVGMLSAAAKAGRDAGNDTLTVSMAQNVVNDMRVTEFAKLWEENIYTGAPVYDATPGAPAVSVCYFTAEGDMLPVSGGDGGGGGRGGDGGGRGGNRW